MIREEMSVVMSTMRTTADDGRLAREEFPRPRAASARPVERDREKRKVELAIAKAARI